MTDFVQDVRIPAAAIRPRRLSPEASAARTRRRYRAERRFRAVGLVAIMIALGLLVLLLTTIVLQGYKAFAQTTIRLNIAFAEAAIDPNGTRDPDVLARASYAKLVNDALYQLFPDVEEHP
jgi:phosphate transport system permease protein